MAAINKLKGFDKVMKNLNKEIFKLKNRTQAGVTASALFIKGEAVSQAPIVEGNLRASGFVASPHGVAEGGSPNFVGKQQGKMKSQHSDVTKESADQLFGSKHPVAHVGFTAVYAVRVHENPRAGKTGGFSPSGKPYSAGRTTSGARSTRKVFATEGSWKFLENALKNNTKKVLQIIAQKARIR